MAGYLRQGLGMTGSHAYQKSKGPIGYPATDNRFVNQGAYLESVYGHSLPPGPGNLAAGTSGNLHPSISKLCA